ncbi:hypothetical protein FB107DRAFT_224927, partial [Schizophyllum commune]
VLSERLLERVKMCEIRDEIYGASDHCPVVMETEGVLWAPPEEIQNTTTLGAKRGLRVWGAGRVVRRARRRWEGGARARGRGGGMREDGGWDARGRGDGMREDEGEGCARAGGEGAMPGCVHEKGEEGGGRGGHVSRVVAVVHRRQNPLCYVVVQYISLALPFE